MLTSLPKKPVDPSYDEIPQGEVILIHGLPKVGKTTFSASWPDNCIIEVEKSGARWVKGAYVAEPNDLKDLDQAIKLLKNDTRFKAVTLDTVDTLSLWIEKFICKKYGVTAISLAGGGYGIGRNELNTMLIGYIDELVSTKKTVILISHCRDSQGTKSLLLTETLLTYIQGKASIIGYAYKEVEGGKLEFRIDYGGRGNILAAGSRQPRLARAGVLGNHYSDIEELFAPRPASWNKMLKWYENNGITLEGVEAYVKDFISEDAEIATLTPEEIKKLVSVGSKQTKHKDEFETFKEKYGTKEDK